MRRKKHLVTVLVLAAISYLAISWPEPGRSNDPIRTMDLIAQNSASNAATTEILEQEGSHVTSDHWVSIAIESGFVADHFSEIIKVLEKEDLLQSQQVKVKAGDTAVKIYKEALGTNLSLQKTAAVLNNSSVTALNTLDEKDSINVPLVETVESNYVRTINLNDESEKMLFERIQDSGYFVKSEPLEGEPEVVNVYLKSYELRVPFEDYQQLEQGLEVLESYVEEANSSSRLRTPGLRLDSSVYYPTSSEDDIQPKSFSFSNAQNVRYLTQRELERLSPQDLESQEFWIGGLLSGQDASRPEGLPTVVLRLFDTLLYQHWEITRGWVVEPPPKGRKRTEANSKSSSTGIQETSTDDHANHLAGIVAAQTEKPPRGLVGIVPEAAIYNYPVRQWTSTAAGKRAFMGELQKMRSANNSVVLSAVDFTPKRTNSAGKSEPRIFNSEQSLKQDDIVKGIVASSPLWVVAAGHSEKDLDGKQITYQSGFLNGLGFLQQVLTVTACEPCKENQFALMPNANHSGSHVHVAAPGAGIVSHNSVNGWGRDSGTSQASAFVAGVALDLLHRYGNCFNEPYVLKERLQLTSFPVPVSTSRRAIAAGFVELPVALLDPKATWKLERGDNRYKGVAAGGYKEIKDISNENLIIYDGASEILASGEILRVVQTNQSNDGWWYIYKKPNSISKSTHGKVEKLDFTGFFEIMERVTKDGEISFVKTGLNSNTLK